MRLLAVYVDEHASGMMSRAEVREQVEQQLDDARPEAQQRETHGRSLDAGEWAAMLERLSPAQRAQVAANAAGNGGPA